MTGSTCTPGWISRQAILGARPVPVAPFPSGGAVPGGLVILAGDWMDRSGRRGRGLAAAPSCDRVRLEGHPSPEAGFLSVFWEVRNLNPDDSILF